jgi:phosphoribosylglycinamide formyltransferase 1
VEIPKLGVLISGRGSNLQALIDAIAGGTLHATIAVVISNIATAPGLERARRAGIETLVMPHSGSSRDAYDRELVQALEQRRVNLVCLAGFMRRLGPAFIAAFPNRILNIHPSLLPAFPGLDAQRQAFDHGVKITGATVHIVDADLDTGPIVLQAPVPVLPGDTVASLAERILEAEHRIYPQAVQLMLDGEWEIEGRRLVFTARTEAEP